MNYETRYDFLFLSSEKRKKLIKKLYRYGETNLARDMARTCALPDNISSYRYDIRYCNRLK